jgi:SAM-dependent methyltransferase
MISDALLSLVRCPDCHGVLAGTPDSLVCRGCGRPYHSSSPDFLDLRPRVAYAEQTKYLDETLHADARHETVSPPLLGSRIRNDMLRSFLAPEAHDLVVDLGCGSGRTLLWNRDWGSRSVGVDISPFFSSDARQHIDLLIGDLRRLPFADGTFTKAFSLDVLEHLSPQALREMLAEASRVLAPGGELFVYTHVRKNAPVAAGLRWINALGRRLEAVGLIDARQERLRKSDHVNPLRDIPELEQVVSGAGFGIRRIRYYTPIVGGFVENIIMRMAERVMAKRARKRLRSSISADQADALAIREARTAAKARIASSRSTYATLRMLSFLMKLDLLLFGRIRSGPFFALLVKQ